jgi:hypothetical protein
VKIKVAISETKTYEVDADVKDGLAVHNGVVWTSSTGKTRITDNFYTITHVQSKRFVMNRIVTYSDAIKLRDNFLKLTDWTQDIKPDPSDKIIKSLKKKVKKIENDYMEGHK